jgi:tRNA A37 threonylcarbamoyladenosine modification protein TsaB
MYLFIDTSIQEEVRVGVFDSHKILAKKTLKVGFAYSEKLLTTLDLLLKDFSVSQRYFQRKSATKTINRGLKRTERRTTQTTSTWLKQLSGVLVVEGLGRFSALRTGVSVANTLAWSLDVPVIGVKNLIKEQKQSVEKFRGREKSQQYWYDVESIIVDQIKKVKIKKFKQTIVPQYGQELNITIKNKY